MSSAVAVSVAPFPAPTALDQTGVAPDQIEMLMIKTLYGGEATGLSVAERMRLPFQVIEPLLERARAERLAEVRGMIGSGTAAYRYALTEKRGGAVPIIEHQSVADVLADAKSRIEAVRLLAWRALDAVIAQDPAGPELALHAKIFGSETGVEVISRLMNVVGVKAYDSNFPLMAYLSEALAYPVIEGSNTGIRRRQLQDLFRTPGYNPLSASGMA